MQSIIKLNNFKIEAIKQENVLWKLHIDNVYKIQQAKIIYSLWYRLIKSKWKCYEVYEDFIKINQIANTCEA